MELNSDFSISRLFFTKDVTITADGKQLIMHLKTIKDIFTDLDWCRFYGFISKKADENDSKNIYKLLDIQDSYALIKMILFDLGQYEQFRKFYDIIKYGLESLFVNIQYDMLSKQIIIQDVIITPEIWDYIVYILKLSYGENIKPPMQFDSEEARQFFLAQQQYEEKIRNIRNQNGGEDSILKVLLTITYAFPSLTIDYLGNQTMAQIHWLQKYAGGAVSYNVNAQAFAAGNVKKDSKLEFFIK